MHVHKGESISILRLIAAAAIDYLRWTQLVPMVTLWVFLLLMALTMLFVSFQSESMNLLQDLHTRYPELSQKIAAWSGVGDSAPAKSAGEVGEEGRLHLTDEDIMPLVLKGWAVLALVGSVLGALRTQFLGAAKPTPLRHKLLLAGMLAAMCSGVFFVAFHYGSETFNGDLSSWLPLFMGLPLFVWVVSVYGLGVSHLLGRLRRWIEAG